MTVRRGTPTPITTPIIILLVWVKPELTVSFVMIATEVFVLFAVVFWVTVVFVVAGFVVFVVVVVVAGFVVLVVVV